jgi:hypothetical protein
MKAKSFIRKTILALLILAVIDACIFWIIGPHTLVGFYDILCYSGIMVFILSLFLIGGSRWYPSFHSRTSDDAFMKTRALIRPFEETIVSLLAAAVIVFSIGEVLALIT